LEYYDSSHYYVLCLVSLYIFCAMFVPHIFTVDPPLFSFISVSLAVKSVLPPLVSGPGERNSESLLNLTRPRMRGPCISGVPWRELLLPCWYYLCPRCSRQCDMSRFDSRDLHSPSPTGTSTTIRPNTNTNTNFDNGGSNTGRNPNTTNAVTNTDTTGPSPSLSGSSNTPF